MFGKIFFAAIGQDEFGLERVLGKGLISFCHPPP